MSLPQLSSNLRRLSRMDMPGGGQVIVEGRYAYVGHMKPPHGTTIIDVSDPRAPRIVGQITLPDSRSHTHKVRVTGDIMVTNVEQNERHLMRRGSRIPAAEAALAARLGRPPSEEEIAAEIKVKPAVMPKLRASLAEPYTEGGFKIYDIRDRSNPKLLHYQKTFGFGTHRFDLDANYAYISTEMEGYVGNILVIYSLADPARPVEVSRWWMPGQHVAGGEVPSWEGYKNRLHHTLRSGDQLFASVWNAGLRVIDVSDITKPTTVGAYNYHPPFPEPTHTVMKIPFPLKGREVVAVVDEEHDHVPGQLHAGLWLFDVGDLKAIKPISMFHVSEMDSPYSRVPGGRFGAHQFQEKMVDTRLYIAWFSGGLRVVDIADPERPTEVGYFIPEPCPGHASPQSNDVDLDDRGLIYLLDRDRGLDILEMTA
ncbi:MAG: hypothetical protein OHK0024_02220 [Thalassobaculales bacterium]